MKTAMLIISCVYYIPGVRVGEGVGVRLGVGVVGVGSGLGVEGEGVCWANRVCRVFVA